MTLLHFVWRSLVHYRGVNAATILICALTTAVIVGSLVVGDSVEVSMANRQAVRIGRVQAAMVSGDRFFRAALAEEVANGRDGLIVAPVMQILGVASTPDQRYSTGKVNVLGVDGRFAALGPTGNGPIELEAGKAAVNTSLANRLRVAVGDRILIRVAKPTALPGETAYARTEDTTTALSVEVGSIVDRNHFGSFSLRNDAQDALNAFVPLDWLADRLDLHARANAILVGSKAGADVDLADLQARIDAGWTLEDVRLESVDLATKPLVQWASPRVFLDDAVFQGTQQVANASVGAFSYFVNGFSHGEHRASYGVVSGLGAINATDSEQAAIAWLRTAPIAEMADDAIIINEWLAEDLQADVGDVIEMRYFVIGPDQRLVEESHSFEVSAVVSMSHAVIDPSLMPDIPGLSDSENCRDWDPGMPIELSRITDRDEEYWDRFRGAPKALITLDAAQALWSNRFGNLTALRTDADSSVEFAQELRAQLDGREFGFVFTPTRRSDLANRATATDFAGLFLGLSLFLMIAGFLLLAMVFVLGLEQRTQEVGVLSAVGFSRSSTTRVFLIQGVLLATIGAVLGVGLGVGYTRLVLAALGSIWSDAVAATGLTFHAHASSLLIGMLSTIVVATATMWLTIRRQVGRTVTDLTAATGSVRGTDIRPVQGRALNALWMAALLLAIGLVIAAWIGERDTNVRMGLFLISGVMMLAAGLLLSASLLRPTSSVRRQLASISALSRVNATRRRFRSLTTVVLLALGCFSVILTGAFSPQGNVDDRDRSSGTGGFQLLGESTLPILHDLHSSLDRHQATQSLTVVPMRLRAGDDASCLNLAQTTQPRLLAIDTDDPRLHGRFAFAQTVPQTGASENMNRWHLLRPSAEQSQSRIYPAIGDAATITWSLHKEIGDEIEYTDAAGEPFRVKIVGTLKNSLFQGSLIIDDDVFKSLFPEEIGFRTLLIETPRDASLDEVSEAMSLELGDTGLALMSTTQRLAEYAAVQNTYLSIFQVLGAMGLALGTLGLALIVARNMLERRSELALFTALGFTVAQIRRIVFLEHAWLVAFGIGTGTVAGLVASLAGADVGSQARSGVFALGLAIVLVFIALTAIHLSIALVLRRPLLQALRAE